MNIIEQFGLDEENFIWQDLVMCLNIPTNAFFEDSESSEAINRAVREICSYCPVQSMCLEKAQKDKAQGIHAGKRLSGGRIID